MENEITYNPERAAADARHDIAKGKIKIFFQAVSIVPFPVGLEMKQKFPHHEHINFGQGCCDPIHSPDCPKEHRKFMAAAEKYAKIYNQEIAKHFKLKTTKE